MALAGGDDDDDDSPHALVGGRIPAARMHSVESLEPHQGFLTTLGLAGPRTKTRIVRNGQTRRDMLADEDTRSFGEWYDSRQRDGTGGSTWSLLSILGAGVRRRSRDPSGSVVSHKSGGLPTPWREKSDPFSDGASLMRDEETGFIGAAAVGAAGSVPHRPQARRDMSYASSRSGYSYRDPFADPIEEEGRILFDAKELYSDNDHSSEPEIDPSRPSIRPVPPLTPLRTVLPLAHAAHPLSPLSEHTSQSTLGVINTSNAGSSLGHSNDITPFDASSNRTSLTSAEPTPPPHSPQSPQSTSIIGASNPSLLSNNQPMRRSNSWWTRFSRTSLLDRRSSTASRGGYDIRDPNPPPKLGPIEERSVISSADKASPHGSSPGSAGADKQLGSKTSPSPRSQQASHPPSRANSMRIYSAGLSSGKSMSSLRTADSEAIERMAGTMEVIQRVKTRSQRGTGSTSSAEGMSHRNSVVSEVGERTRENSGSWEGSFIGPGDAANMVTSPVDQDAPPSHPLADLVSEPVTVVNKPSTTPLGISPPPPLVHRPRSDTSGGSSSDGKVADRVKAYERRMSMDQPISPPPSNTKHKEERSKKRVEVDYGLVPRRSLYVANPDHKLSSTDDS